MSEATTPTCPPTAARPSVRIRHSTSLGPYSHLRIERNLLVTDWSALGEGEFALRARWPEAGSDPLRDPRLLLRTVRQSGLIVAHAAYGVPLSHQTLLRALEYEIPTPVPDPGAPPGAAGGTGRTHAVTVDLSVAPTSRHGRVGSLSMRFRIRRPGAPTARARATFDYVSPTAYRRLRGERAEVAWADWPVPPGIEPERAGRYDPRNVVLAADGRPHGWLLRNDTADDVLFDHPVDHVPGLVLMEAADQAARARLFPVLYAPTRVRMEFSRYVEFDRPCVIEAEPFREPDAPGLSVRVTGSQDGEQAVRAELYGTVE
ncbi:A-factor biosynthesis protein [Streptomyces sp. LP05-1]|uniref:A-factor biosynthesis protein n=1 Tax=Streptomyces pyxinae TaxID=2970734 RepID=A0ABT2CG33_9ACTN|nr:ScbA/BarX family gamma-butyrolactone biosynthesis protein [Streptomyces sp. LP05-1]MCS0636047.1 A-factor biosynthesis protein [Streptomyces sp. LP05-1]